MRSREHPLGYVDNMIDFLEQKIESNAVTSAGLEALQKRLDVISGRYAHDPVFVKYYPRMLELQTLIYGEGGQEKKALLYLKEAVRETGSVGRLYSNLLKQYIASKSKALDDNGLAQNAYANSDHGYERKRGNLGRLKVGAAAIIVLAAVIVGVLHFVPRASALPNIFLKHSELARDKQLYESYVSQYKACEEDLVQQKSAYDPNDMPAVVKFNDTSQHCSDLLRQQKQVVAQYNSVMGASTGTL